MFTRVMKAVSRKNVRRGVAVVAVLAAVGVAAPYAMAGGNDWREHDRGRDRWDGRIGVVIRPQIVIGRPPVVVVEHRPAVRVEVAPSEVHFAAYQSQDRVILDIKGSNRGEGFTTTVSSCDLNGYAPTIDVCNLAPADNCGGRDTSFCITTSLGSRRALSNVSVRIAGRSYSVPVTQAVSLN